jgi:hypothetical protein
MKKIIQLLLVLSYLNANAQHHLYDTSYYEKFYDKTLWSMYINSVNNVLALKQSFNADTSIKTSLDVNAESLQEYGISFANHKQYVMIRLFGLPSSGSKQKPIPKYSNAFYVQSDRNYLLEMGYNWYSNFYEKNSSNFIKNFNDSLPYYKYGKLRSLNTFINYAIFRNYKKFSYRGAYMGTARQKKSAATLLYFFNTNYNRLESDSAIIPYYIRKNYNEFGELYRLYNLHAVAGGGGSATLVAFKSLFINGTVMLGPGLQFQQYSFKPVSGFKTRLGFLFYSDVRLAVGINLKKFVLSNTTLINYKTYNIKKLNLTNTLLSNTFSIGYRFNTRSTKIVRR